MTQTLSSRAPVAPRAQHPAGPISYPGHPESRPLRLLLAQSSEAKESEPQESGKLGRFPPMMHHHQAPLDGQTPTARAQRSHLAEAFAKAKGSGGGTGGGGGSGRGLMGQIIPIYGFGIFLYILYILFKLSKGKTTAVNRKCSTTTPGDTFRKITNFELVQLQEKLKETEEAMEKLINRVGPNGERIQTDHNDIYVHCQGALTTKWLDCLIFLSRAQTVTSDQEKQLLYQLREITRVMKKGRFTDRPTPEQEAEEAPYMEDWEGYPEETYPIYDLSDCIKRRQETILVDYPDPKEPSAEELAERMGVLEESDHLGWEVPTDGRAQEENSVTSCDPKPETCSCCLHKEEDPAVLVENADSYSEQEDTTQEAWPQDFRDEGLGVMLTERVSHVVGAHDSILAAIPRGCYTGRPPRLWEQTVTFHVCFQPPLQPPSRLASGLPQADRKVPEHPFPASACGSASLKLEEPRPEDSLDPPVVVTTILRLLPEASREVSPILTKTPFVTKHRKGPESRSLSAPLQVTLGLSHQPRLSSAWTLIGAGGGGGVGKGAIEQKREGLGWKIKKPNLSQSCLPLPLYPEMTENWKYEGR
ncbi:hypothetical protein QTO34_003761 [Cnephaeus nilssonii]|uniref:Resistance to inhibitors of cholinesterase protein 3 N-terminal domain-containing protein n=1 Tax=Cnephaeus nilssonii TaxID=3371016 RepID=A0AA40HS35_CNENI|nr:hypothetical protein QTO34_003761 [Eptesicus nilssonii]